ncbi:hypothetical protein GYMLUDRAFT_241823 [Collybiopsis luxurians FD-317 M1]|uniref:Unplaced genomic scaffold GYMLUscaffold_16, whole genome shotgun sequence n=1 Tax=Collybiopsis luxurians FD-317 M1 TaxID=944289 RepID=A0A0D0C5B2_9AGAR|nr:hypothetical protein GYMLUDRAFT_241823 [Collybiopsis luxurians FD-317 M1]
MTAERARSPKPLRHLIKWNVAARNAVYARLVFLWCYHDRTKDSIDEKQPHFLRCLNPSPKKKPSPPHFILARLLVVASAAQMPAPGGNGQNILSSVFYDHRCPPFPSQTQRYDFIPHQLSPAFFIGRPRAIVLRRLDILEYKLVHNPVPPNIKHPGRLGDELFPSPSALEPKSELEPTSSH